MLGFCLSICLLNLSYTDTGAKALCYVVWNNGWAQPAMGVSITPRRQPSFLYCLKIHSSWLQELSVIPRNRDSEQSTGDVSLIQSPLSKTMK